MKKVILSVILALTFISAQAQWTLEGFKFRDNWSITARGGAFTPMTKITDFDYIRYGFGLNIQKMIVPAFGIGFEGDASIKTSEWFITGPQNYIDHQYVGMYLDFNLMNLFGGYYGVPRVFELEATAGAGWLHAYTPGKGNDANSWGTKFGLNINFNLGSARAWTIGLRPAVLYNMGGSLKRQGGALPGQYPQFNIHNAVVELMAGITYHFLNSNYTHSFTIAQLRDQGEIDGLNSTINGLRNDLENCNANNAALQSKINSLQAELDACNARPTAVKEVIEDLSAIRYVFFNLASSVILNTQRPNLELVANSVKERPGSTITIKGYASPEGSLSFNQRLSARRADAVKKALVNNYNINPSSINAEGCGIGDVFSVPSWNRVAIITVNQ
ncbi:MAG: OmpA family protein [Muribaculaceae bacterium]|nr:OmpA family protein [Muribaculaceae bacterium]MDE5844089.1 OmpA family protein [Muribaculaceae bacterium]MDE5857601.1 OmpA family protein [Muribaculaceae bacterium]MDE7368203.1 OmpA family protein [Muribaculaceae bacterium]